ncbi:MAG: cytochrome b/b6 domain-containing protein [Thermoanaerobaculia bacterium]|nr:cytochrome b/b6 domain-containing protein [Thermoanaerobaculia bacterium]MCZ7651520.1 cytochrome c3 family protein [Thermoanaerobaculia bacterium]
MQRPHSQPKGRRGIARLALFALLPLGLLAAAAGAQESSCTDCHEVDVAAFEQTVHGSLSCIDCHAGAAAEEHDAEMARADCADCHGDAVEALAASVHGHAEFLELSGQDSCTTCHGKVHALVPAGDPASPVHPVRLPETCGHCHSSGEMAKRFGFRFVQPLSAYEASVHHKALLAGKESATCSSCHGAHDILPGTDSASKVHYTHVPALCGECHGEIATVFGESVHGVAAAKGVRESPVCTDCHGEHRIIGPGDAGSPVSASNVPTMTCGRCHGDLRVTERFGLDSRVVSSFQDSFHGLANRAGSQTVANCASCHGIHDIQPSTDPRSHTHPDRVAETCGSCHPGAGTRFPIGAVHVLPQDRDSAHPAVYWARNGYLWLIWLTIGGMFVHNFLDLRRKALSPIPRPQVPLHARRERLSLGFRLAHAATALSFMVLVYTGFALKYPEAGWAAPLLIWESQFGLRGWLHRLAAVVMMAAFVGHFLHVAFDRRARRVIAAMRPTIHDAQEVVERVKWYLGRRKTMPHAPPLGYIEKAEYLALVWGTVVMAVTGFILWFENWSLAYLPKWVSDLATVVHFYEAVLATLAIIVWHFYWVMFDPLIYPMDTAWLTGKEAPGRTLERTAPPDGHA